MREGWVSEVLKEATLFKSGKTVSRDIEKDTGEILYTKVGDMNLEGNEEYIMTSTRYVDLKDINVNQIIPIGSVIFPKRGGAIATNKKRRIIKPTIVDLNTMAVGPKEKIHPDYLYYWFESIDLKELSNGTSIPQINNNSFDNVYISYPESLNEQKQIVAILDKAFAALDQAKSNISTNIENAKELFDSKIAEYFDQLELENDLLPIAESCEKIIAGGDKPKPNFSKTETDEYDIPVIANGEKNDGLFGFTNIAKVTKPAITVSARGTIGYTSFRDYPFVPIVRLIVLIPKTDLIIVEYLMYAIKNLDILRTGSSIPQLTVPMIKEYSIPVPSKRKQKEIVEILKKLEIELEEYRTALERKAIQLEELKKSILQKALSGALTRNEVTA